MEDRTVRKLLEAEADRAPVAVPAAWPARGHQAIDDRVTSSI